MTERTSRSTRIGAVLFGFICVLWCAREPYRPDRLYHAMPLGADMVLTLDNATEWLSRLKAHPALKDAAILHRKDLEPWLERYGKRSVLISRGRTSQFSGTEVWSAAIWLGADVRPLRLALETGFIDGVSSVGDRRMGSAWRLDDPVEGRIVSFALTEGMLLLSASANEDAVQSMLMAVHYDRRLPAVVLSRASLAEETNKEKDPQLRVWADTARFGTRGDEVRHVSGKLLDRRDANALQGEFKLKRPQGPILESTSEDLKQPFKLLGGDSSILLAGDNALLAGLWGREVPEWVQLILRKETGEESRRVVVSMLRTDVPASVAGLGVPAFAVALECKDREHAVGEIDRLIEAAGRFMDLRLAPEKQTVAGEDVLVLGLAEKGSYNVLGPDERPTCFVQGRWLFMVNGLPAAAYLLSKRQGAPADPASLVTLDLKGDNIVLFGTIQPEAASASLRRALAGYYAAVLAGEMEDSFFVKQNYRRWMNTLEQMPLWGEPLLVVRDDVSALMLEITVSHPAAEE